MVSAFKKFGIPLLVVIAGGAILGTIWWMNGAEREDSWLYVFSFFLVLYAAYELFKGFSKHYKD